MNTAHSTEQTRAVIYARYSSHGQTEQSIEGQLRDDYAYCEREGLLVVGEYIEMKIAKMIQFENMNPPRKAKNKGFRHIQ